MLHSSTQISACYVTCKGTVLWMTRSQNMQHHACSWSAIQILCKQKIKTLFCCKINSPNPPYSSFANLLLLSLSKGHKITIVLYKFLSMSQDSLVGIVTGLQAGGSRSWIQVQATYFSLPQNVHTSSEDHTTPHSRLPGFLPRGKTAGGMKLATHLHLVLTLKVSGATPLLPHTPS